MLSRVADSLYWMSRYLERAEHTARVVDVGLNLMLDQTPGPRGTRWDRVLSRLNPAKAGGGLGDPYSIAHWLTFDRSNRASISACVASARENARQVREMISSEMWEQLNRLHLHVIQECTDGEWPAHPAEFLGSVKDGANLFHGLTQSTMCHDECFHFMELGRFLERAGSVAGLVDVELGASFPLPNDPTPAAAVHLDWVGLLQAATAFEAYCKVYTAELHPDRIAEFLLLSPDFPHSVRFAVDRVVAALGAIASTAPRRDAGRLERLGGRLAAALGYGQIDEILDGGLHEYLDDVRRRAVQIHSALHEFYFAYPVESALNA